MEWNEPTYSSTLCHFIPSFYHFLQSYGYFLLALFAYPLLLIWWRRSTLWVTSMFSLLFFLRFLPEKDRWLYSIEWVSCARLVFPLFILIREKLDSIVHSGILQKFEESNIGNKLAEKFKKKSFVFRDGLLKCRCGIQNNGNKKVTNSCSLILKKTQKIKNWNMRKSSTKSLQNKPSRPIYAIYS